MPKKREEKEIKVVIDNPECIPIAKKRLIKFLYDEYVRETPKEDIYKLHN